jgi:hypothetical protein
MTTLNLFTSRIRMIYYQSWITNKHKVIFKSILKIKHSLANCIEPFKKSCEKTLKSNSSTDILTHLNYNIVELNLRTQQIYFPIKVRLYSLVGILTETKQKQNYDHP